MKPDDAPRLGCHCQVCRWLRDNAVARPFGLVRPGTVEWEHLMRAAGAGGGKP